MTNEMVWDGRKCHYEVYFLKFNDVGQRIAAWIRYTLLAPQEGDPVAEVWGFFFNRDEPGQNLALKNTYPWAKAVYKKNPFGFQIACASLTHTSAMGEIEKDGRRMAWNLRWEDSPFSLRLFPYRWMYTASFPRTKVLSPHPDLRISGTLEVCGRIYHIGQAWGLQSHLWGSHYAHSWTWCHCNIFEEDHALMEGLSACVPIGPIVTPPLNIFLLYFRNRLYRLNSISSIIRNQSHSKVGCWKFQATGSGIRMEGEATAVPSLMVGAAYTGPFGERRWCHNCKVGDLWLVIRHGRGVTTLSAKGTCAIEWVQTHRASEVGPWA